MEKALHNYIWDVIGKQRMENLKMFDLRATKGEITEEKKKEIKCYLDSATAYSDPEQITKIDMNGYSMVREVSIECPYDPEL